MTIESLVVGSGFFVHHSSLSPYKPQNNIGVVQILQYYVGIINRICARVEFTYNIFIDPKKHEIHYCSGSLISSFFATVKKGNIL